MVRQYFLTCSLAVLFALFVSPLQGDGHFIPEQQVKNTERAFARTMADRDFEAFKSFLSQEAVFFAGDTPTKGKQAVADSWARFYEDEEAPFSWEPGIAAVLESGTLALSSGPVFNAAGDRIGTFNSIWRLDDHGDWKIVFDKGGQYCPPPDAEERD